MKRLIGPSSAPELLNSLAVTQLKLGEVGDAVESLQHALKSSPRELSSSIMLAIAKLMQKDPTGAEEVLKKACENAPNSADPVVVLGEFYAGQHRQPEAAAEVSKALQIDPKKYPARFDLAQIQNAREKNRRPRKTSSCWRTPARNPTNLSTGFSCSATGSKTRQLRSLKGCSNKIRAIGKSGRGSSSPM